MTSVRVQSVLFHMPLDDIRRALASLERACALAKEAGLLDRVEIAWGDCSPAPTMSEEDLRELAARFAAIDAMTCEFFGDNLGSAAGHNRLARGADADYLLIMNPDVVAAPRALSELLLVARDPAVGIVEAKQIPIEHPKDYDRATGATSWCATAFALIPRGVFEQLEGFDSETFFLYCDDVDFSWRVREAGLTAVHQPSAVVFHDKRVAADAGWAPTAAERYFAAEAGLLLPYKWSRDDLLQANLDDFARADDPVFDRALATFRRREVEGPLPARHDPAHRIGQFRDGFYADHRFAL